VALDKSGAVVREFKGTTGGAEHYADFFDAVKTRQQPAADVVIGHDSTNWSHVINAAWRSARGEGLVPAGELPGGAASDAVARLLREHVTAYGSAISTDALALGPRMQIDPARELFVGPAADAANAFLGPREFRKPYVLEAVPLAAAATAS
jgi:hypothetical protein